MKFITIIDKLNFSGTLKNLASYNRPPILASIISGTQQSTEKCVVKASTNVEKILGKETISFSYPISSDLANTTTKYQLPNTLIGDSDSSIVNESDFSQILIDLSLGKIDSNTQSNTTFPFSYLQRSNFPNTKTRANMLAETRIKDHSRVKKKEITSLWQIQQNNSIIDWVKLTPNKVIMVTPDQVFVYRPNSEDSDNFFAQPTNNAGNIATTKKLLDTAIVLAKREADSSPKLPALSPITWVWSLASQYHLTHFTPGLMKEASRYFSNQGRDLLAEWAEQKAIEETGHDRLALLDIESLGYKAEAVVKAFVPLSATVLLDYFIDSVQTSDPIKCVGYSYTLERLALAIGKEHIQAVETRMRSGTNATRCLRVHSSIGSDVEHVEEIIEMVAKLTPKERTQIAIACYETAKLYFSSSKNDYPSEEELQQKLQAFKSNPLQ